MVGRALAAFWLHLLGSGQGQVLYVEGSQKGKAQVCRGHQLVVYLRMRRWGNLFPDPQNGMAVCSLLVTAAVAQGFAGEDDVSGSPLM